MSLSDSGARNMLAVQNDLFDRVFLEQESQETAEQKEDNEVTLPTNKTKPQEKAVYCPDCDMWLNGPTQWTDHEIGKKHVKKCKAKSLNDTAKTEVQVRMGEHSASSPKLGLTQRCAPNGATHAPPCLFVCFPACAPILL